MADLAKVKRNVSKMVSMNAPEEDIDSYIQSEGTSVEEVRAFKGDSQVDTKQKTPSMTGLPQDITDNPRIQPQNALGQVANVPAAALRSLLQGKGYTQGALQPDQVPTFSQKEQEMPMPQRLLANLVGGGNVGMKADFATDPSAILGALPIEQGVGMAAKGAKGMGGVMKWESALQRSRVAKEGLDTLRDTLGKAKTLAVEQVKNASAELDFAGNVSQKVVDAIKNPIYGVEFGKEGSVVNTVGNLDKVKTAVGELISNDKVWEEAPKTEQRWIKQFYGKVNQSMIDGAKKAGVDIKEPMKAYAEFMDKYKIVNKTLEDSAGNALANKMKGVFKIGAEPAIQEAWKSVSKHSPEVKSVMNSMQKRELLKRILIAGPTAAGAYEGGKRMVTGNF